MNTTTKMSPKGHEPADGLYATWTGHRHPLLPRSPVAFKDLPKLKVFYRAIFEGEAPVRRMMVFDKFRISVRYLPGQAELTHQAPCYAALEIDRNEFRAGAPLTPNEALADRRWIVLTGRDSDEGPQLIEIERLSRTRYTYRVDGEVSNVAIEDATGSRVIRAQQ